MARSRLTKQKKKTIYLSVLGIVVLIALIAVFGIPLLVNFSLLVEKSRGGDDTAKNTTDEFVVVPELNATFAATNSAQIAVSGFSERDYTVRLYVNGKRVDETDVKSNKTFEFRKVKLEEGENIIKVQAENNGNKSEFSDEITISYNSEPPSLELTSPQNDQSFSGAQSPIRVAGTTDENAKVTVNGFWAIVDSNGNFSYTMQLLPGDNQVKVVATDNAGNKTEKDLKVSYSP